MVQMYCVTKDDIDTSSIECNPEFCSAALKHGAYILVDKDMNAFIEYGESELVRVRIDDEVKMLFSTMFL